MSIQTELTRITNAKAAIKAAIEGKGVTVPDGSTSDALAGLIASIEAGGVPSITGTVTLTGSWSSYKLFTYDELVKIFGEPLPTLLVLFYSNDKVSTHRTDLVLWKSDESYARVCYKSSGTSSNVGINSTLSTTIPTLDESGLSINKYSSYYIAPIEYRYCIVRYD